GASDLDENVLTNWAAQSEAWNPSVEVADGKVQTYRFEIPSGRRGGGGGPPPPATPPATNAAPATNTASATNTAPQTAEAPKASVTNAVPAAARPPRPPGGPPG